MIKVQSLLFILFFFCASLLKGQDVNQILLENRWSAYDNFAIIDFFENGQAELEYAYCSYCKTNTDTVDWKVQDKLLVIGEDTLTIKSASANEITTNQPFSLKNVNKLKKGKLKKEIVQKFLVAYAPLKLKTEQKGSDKVTQLIKFDENGRMWLDDPKYKGQWALKSFYGELFLIYVHRNSVNREFPLLKIKSLKKGKLIGQPIPSASKGVPFVLEISN